MSVGVALFLAVVQGLTEFLPISSSGHLRLFQAWFGIAEPQTLFDVLLHAGTLGATIFIFRVEVWRILTSLARVASGRAALSSEEGARLGLLVAAGSVPTGLIGATLGPVFEESLTSVPIVGGILLVNGFVLASTRWLPADSASRGPGELRLRDALIIGTVQGFAVLRGISRSGSTITCALWLGARRDTAGVFSFLLSIPAILGALAFELRHGLEPAGGQAPNLAVLALAACASAMVGGFALVFLMRVVKRGGLHHFAPYCWAVGAAALIWSATR
jgi:undecaprenyl-diphosphatase